MGDMQTQNLTAASKHPTVNVEEAFPLAGSRRNSSLLKETRSGPNCPVRSPKDGHATLKMEMPVSRAISPPTVPASFSDLHTPNGVVRRRSSHTFARISVTSYSRLSAANSRPLLVAPQNPRLAGSETSCEGSQASSRSHGTQSESPWDPRVPGRAAMPFATGYSGSIGAGTRWRHCT